LINAIKKLFQTETSGENKPGERSHYALPALALLVETAKADRSLDEQELVTVIQLAKEYFSVSDSESHVLLELARDHTTEATSLYEFTSLINENFSDDEKLKVIQAMWIIAYVDDRIDRYEEHLIRKVADLIYVPHVKFIEAKHIAQEQSKNPPTGDDELLG